MSLPRYPAYKPSGVEWLGEVPAHWGVKRLKRTCAVHPSNVDKKSYEDELPVVLCNYTDVYRNDVIRAEMDFMPATAAREQVEKFSLRAGDVLITKDSETADDIAISAYVPNDLPGVVCGYHLSIVRPHPGVSGAYVKRLFDAAFAKAYFEVRANGLTRVGLSQYTIDNVECPWPPLAEQEAIAAFLDRETARVDALVAEQGRLIALLKEKRQAVISHAVTRGLNPDAPRKPSGVAWLGDVPAHWEVKRLKWVAKMESGHTPDKKIPEYWDGGSIQWVSLNDTSYLRDNEYISETAVAVTQAGLDNSSAHLLPAGCVVFSRDATIGRCAIAAVPLAVSQHFIAWVCSPRLQPEFLLYCFRSMTQELERLATGATVKTIGMPEVRTLATTVPPLSEQGQIVEWIRRETAAIDALIAEAERAIVLLGERRAALIAAAVTGQMDVRGVAAGEGV